MLPLAIALVALALVGHAAFWVGVMNRWHALGFRRPLVKCVLLLLYLALIAIPPALFLSLRESPPSDRWTSELNGAMAYVAFCVAFGAMQIPLWALRRWRSRRLPLGVQIKRNRVVDVARHLGFSLARGPRARAFCCLPGNQLWQLHVSEFSVGLPRLPRALDGLSICHWSDLHLSGRVDQAYYHEVVRLTNDIDVDLIALSGDICDVTRCIDWIPETLGPAKARLGKYFILGNHDLRTKAVGRVRDAMREAGFTDVANRREKIDGGQIAIAGDERPWFKTPLEPADAPGEPRERPLKILLSHTPDRLRWARAHDFDLMLAGHTHGGQIRFPIIGPVICPSLHGVKYAAGFFDEPPTLLHVSRGTGSLLPLRLNCPPEITKLVLHRAQRG